MLLGLEIGVGVGRSVVALAARLDRRGMMRYLLDSPSRAAPSCASAGRSSAIAQPPIGARGLAPQKTCVPSIPMMCTNTRFSTIDFAVAVPTPTGPPLAL